MSKSLLFSFKLCCIFLCIQSFQKVNGQGRTGYLLGTGLMYYNGDLDEETKKIISPSKVFNPFVKAGINYRIGTRSEASLAFQWGSIEAADSLDQEKNHIIRNQSFKSVIQEVSFQLEYHLFNVYRQRTFNPYIFGGIGVFRFNPTAELNGVAYELQPLGTEGQYIGTSNYPKPYKLIQASIPVGIGIYLQLNPHWRLKIDYANHFTLTDYLDDVSTQYADSTLLAHSRSGLLAASLASKRLDGYPNAGRSRGNPKFHDSFSHIGITILYNPGELGGARGYGAYQGGVNGGHGHKRKKKNSCPAYD